MKDRTRCIRTNHFLTSSEDGDVSFSAFKKIKTLRNLGAKRRRLFHVALQVRDKEEG